MMDQRGVRVSIDLGFDTPLSTTGAPNFSTYSWS